MKPPNIFTFFVTVLFFILVLIPILYILSMPFLAQGSEKIFQIRHFSLAFKSVILASSTTFLCAVIGVPLALILSRTNLWAKQIFVPVLLIPAIIPPYIHAIVWNHQSQLIQKLFSIGIHNLPGVIFVLTLAYFPFVFLLTFSGLCSVDKSFEDASLMTHNKLQTIQKVTIPLVCPHIFAGSAFIFIFSIIDFSVPDILRVNVYPIEIFIQFSAFYNEKAAVILSFPIITLTIFIIILQQWYMKDRAYIQVFNGASSLFFNLKGIWHFSCFIFCFIIAGFSIGVPLFTLFIRAGELSNYINVFKTSLPQIIYSLKLAFSGTFIIVFLGFALAYLIERIGKFFKFIFKFGSVTLFAIPAITMGICLIKIWNQPVMDIIYSSPFIIIFGYTARFLPFAVLTLMSSLKQLNPHMEEAAFIACSKWIKIMYHIIIPLQKNGLLTAFFIIFILCLGELGTTLLLIPPGTETIGIKIYNLMHYGAHEFVSALCLILILIIFSTTIFFVSIFRSLNQEN